MMSKNPTKTTCRAFLIDTVKRVSPASLVTRGFTGPLDKKAIPETRDLTAVPDRTVLLENRVIQALKLMAIQDRPVFREATGDPV